MTHVLKQNENVNILATILAPYEAREWPELLNFGK